MGLYPKSDGLDRMIADLQRDVKRKATAITQASGTLTTHDHDTSARLTVASSLASLAGKVQGRDFLYLDTGTASTSKIYMVTGASGGIVDDEFSRDDTTSTLGTADSGQTWTQSAAGGPIVTSQRAVRGSTPSSRAIITPGSGPQTIVADIELDALANGDVMDFYLNGTSTLASYGSLVRIVWTAGSSRIDWYIERGGTSTAGAGVTAAVGHTIRVTAAMTSTTTLLLTIENLSNSASYSNSWTDASAVSLTYGGFALTQAVALSAFYLEATGTLAWESADEYVATHTHAYLPAIATVSTKTANYTLTTSDQIILSNNTTLTMTLPSAVTVGAGQQFTVKNIHSTAMTLASTAGNIDGAATQTLAQYESVTVVSDGAVWWIT